jgi:hypothetical protein
VTKFCAECGAKHEMRGFFCSTDCRREFRNRKRNERAGKYCRLCKRRMPKQHATTPVLSEHNATQESVCP